MSIWFRIAGEEPDPSVSSLGGAISMEKIGEVPAVGDLVMEETYGGEWGYPILWRWFRVKAREMFRYSNCRSAGTGMVTGWFIDLEEEPEKTKKAPR